MMRKICDFDILMNEDDDGNVYIQMSAENLGKNGNSEGKCLHRDKVP